MFLLLDLRRQQQRYTPRAGQTAGSGTTNFIRVREGETSLPAVMLETELNVAFAVGAGVVLLSGWVKSRLWVSEPLICLAVGVLMGPVVLDLASLDVRSEPGNVFVNQAARIALAVSIMGAALRLPEGYVARHWPELAVILGLGMPLMWLSASAVAWLFFPLPVLTALLLGAILAPTDPVLADSIVTGTIADESIPARMRDSITAESGSNDGLGLLFVLLPVSLMTHPTGEAITHWVLTTLLWEIVGGLLIGATVGWFAGRCVDWAYDQPFTERVSVLSASVALAVTVLATVRLVGADGLLAVFAAGVAFGRFITRRESPHHHHIQEGIARFFDLPVFVLLGMVVPWSAWLELGWSGVAFAAALLVLRRLPAWLLLCPLLP